MFSLIFYLWVSSICGAIKIAFTNQKLNELKSVLKIFLHKK